MLAASAFGGAMRYEPNIQGFVMSRNTYRNMYKQLIDATTMLDIATTLNHADATPLCLALQPTTTIEMAPDLTQPKPKQPQCTRSVWTQTTNPQHCTIAMQTEGFVSPPPPLLLPDGSVHQANEDVQTKQASENIVRPILASECASVQSYEHTALEGALLRTTMPVTQQRLGGLSVPIDPCPESDVNEADIQTAFSGFTNFDLIHRNRLAMASFLHG